MPVCVLFILFHREHPAAHVPPSRFHLSRARLIPGMSANKHMGALVLATVEPIDFFDIEPCSYVTPVTAVDNPTIIISFKRRSISI
ncbi:hypothetical protein A0H81_01146 [Grifola frondosa]|uniref:Uncharacterized protein n=1 Tax=Grifola frondosa TaxID=5627 RepID=A0A1C7MQ68_GRIFR|nr:hypothetical protein A0H81_01146 [Grifola frondosa]